MRDRVATMKSLTNEYSKRVYSMNNERKAKPKRKLVETAEAESGADRLIRKLDAPECRPFFCKVMYYLPADTRETILEYAMRDGITSPKRYFTKSARRELCKVGVF